MNTSQNKELVKKMSEFSPPQTTVTVARLSADQAAAQVVAETKKLLEEGGALKQLEAAKLKLVDLAKSVMYTEEYKYYAAMQEGRLPYSNTARPAQQYTRPEYTQTDERLFGNKGLTAEYGNGVANLAMLVHLEMGDVQKAAAIAKALKGTSQRARNVASTARNKDLSAYLGVSNESTVDALTRCGKEIYSWVIQCTENREGRRFDGETQTEFEDTLLEYFQAVDSIKAYAEKIRSLTEPQRVTPTPAGWSVSSSLPR